MTRSGVLDRLDLDLFVTSIDAAFACIDENVLLRVTGERPELGMLPLGSSEPLDELLGFHAPPSWRALGLRCAGSSWCLDDALDVPSGDYPLAPEPDHGGPTAVRLTMLVDRDGRFAGVLRAGRTITRLCGLPEGPLGDACRRALGLPTTAPPPSTAELWMRVWLDRVVESLCGGGDRSFAELASLHPAVLGCTALRTPDMSATPSSPDELADATLILATRWRWSRLRLEPDVVDTGRPPLAPHLASWMDDGMFARCLLVDLPSLGVLLQRASEVLPLPSLHDIVDTLALSRLPVPEAQR